jgi:CheY-like chemotaxis protein
MRLEFEPNTSVVPFIENEVADQGVSSEVERMLREGVKAAQEGKRSEARNLLLRVTEADANNENAWLWLASISEYPEELLVFLNNVLRVNSTNERALEWHKATKSLLAKTLVQRGIDAVNDDRKPFARQCFTQAIEHEAENEMAWLWMASVADSEEEKTACFEKVLSVNPDNETAQHSLKLFQSQKTQKLFHEALSAAFDGKHSSAQEMLETVLSQDSELEDAWVLKSHLANSFEERAECFLKLRVLNPDNEMAKANLASWRGLADLLAAHPKAEEAQEVTAETAQPEEQVSPETFNEEHEQVSPASFLDQTPHEQVSPDFSNYLAAESYVEEAQMNEDFSTESEPENQAELHTPESVHFAEPEAVEQEVAAEENLSAENQTEAPENVSVWEEFQNEEVKFEANEPQENDGEVFEVKDELASETKAEEAEMDWAFSATEENQQLSDHSDHTQESADIHEPETQNIDETYSPENYTQEFSNESESNESHLEDTETAVEMSAETPVETTETTSWSNTSPNLLVNYWQPTQENSGEAQTAELTADAPEVSETPEEETDVLEVASDNDYSQQFAPISEDSYQLEELIEESHQTEESATESFEAAEAQSEEQVSMQSEEAAVEPPVEETFNQPKGEPVLCPFCNSENDKQAFSCSSCQTILTLSDLEMLLGQQDVNQEKVQQAVESFERENESYGLNAERMTDLGIGHINLKNHRQGLTYLQEAVRLNPNNVIFEAQVNAFAIRLSEIEEHQNIHDSMPKNCKILVVDDSPTVRKLISGKLEKCGHEVVCAVDGLDALDKINELMPDLILLDITMPRMDGYQVCKMIRSNDATKDVPVVMISGKDGFFDKVRGRMAGTTGYITKPFGPETLMKTVETYLN